MSQTKILEYLEKNKKESFTVKELSEILDVGGSSISKCVKKLRQFGLVETISIREYGKGPTSCKYKYTENEE